MDDRFTVEAARQAARDDELAGWVSAFLSSPGSDNAPLAAELVRRTQHWLGPVQLPLRTLHRLAGPPGQPVLVTLDDDEWAPRVEDLADKIEQGFEPAPLIVSFRDGQLVVEDGNHRAESLRRAGADDAWAVVGFDDERERDRFMSLSSD
jgi:hypothetical protein